MLKRLVALRLISFYGLGQKVGPYENLGFYGAYTWDFHVSITGGKRLITTARSGGNRFD